MGCSQNQLLIGSRLRPQFVLWGYLSCTELNADIPLEGTVSLAVSIELIHKASLLLDDWIDDDFARHGENAFHVDYGAYSAVMTSILMVIESLDRLIKTQSASVATSECFELLIKTTKSMACGAIEELALNNFTQFDYHINRRIALLETAKIISNALLLGYSQCNQRNNFLQEILNKIGELCGFLFQTLNDLESFSDSDRNKQHKGQENHDYDRFRKNLVIAKLYELLSNKEKETLVKMSDIDILMKYYRKYKIEELTIRELEITFNEIITLISSGQKYGATLKWVSGFTEFMYMLKDVASNRLADKSLS